VIAVDGTKVQANASRNENLDYEQLAREIVEQAIATDACEDELYGEARGDELPAELSTEQGRRGWLREAKKRLEAERAADRSRFPEPAPSASRKPSAGWRKSSGRRSARTTPTSITARMAA